MLGDQVHEAGHLVGHPVAEVQVVLRQEVVDLEQAIRRRGTEARKVAGPRPLVGPAGMLQQRGKVRTLGQSEVPVALVRGDAGRVAAQVNVMELDHVGAVEDFGAEHVRRLIDVHRAGEEDVARDLQTAGNGDERPVELNDHLVGAVVQHHLGAAFHGGEEVGEVVLHLGEVHLVEDGEMRLVGMPTRAQEQSQQFGGGVLARQRVQVAQQ